MNNDPFAPQQNWTTEQWNYDAACRAVKDNPGPMLPDGLLKDLTSLKSELKMDILTKQNTNGISSIVMAATTDHKAMLDIIHVMNSEPHPLSIEQKQKIMLTTDLNGDNIIMLAALHNREAIPALIAEMREFDPSVKATILSNQYALLENYGQMLMLCNNASDLKAVNALIEAVLPLPIKDLKTILNGEAPSQYIRGCIPKYFPKYEQSLRALDLKFYLNELDESVETLREGGKDTTASKSAALLHIKLLTTLEKYYQTQPTTPTALNSAWQRASKEMTNAIKLHTPILTKDRGIKNILANLML